MSLIGFSKSVYGQLSLFLLSPLTIRHTANKAIPKIVELSTNLLRKVELLVVDPRTTVKHRFLLKTRGVFRQSEKEVVPEDCAIKGRERMWSRGCNKGSTDVSALWRNG